MELNNPQTGARTAPDENLELDLYSDLSAFILLPSEPQPARSEPEPAAQVPEPPDAVEAARPADEMIVSEQAEVFDYKQLLAEPEVEPVTEWFSDASLDEELTEGLAAADPATEIVTETVEEFFLEQEAIPEAIPELIDEQVLSAPGPEPVAAAEMVIATELVIENVIEDFEAATQTATDEGEAVSHTFLATGDLLKALNAFSDDLLVAVAGNARGIKCPECGDRCDSEELFCVSCGAFLTGLETAPKAGYTCDDCWTAIDPGEVFCPSCGAIAPN